MWCYVSERVTVLTYRLFIVVVQLCVIEHVTQAKLQRDEPCATSPHRVFHFNLLHQILHVLYSTSSFWLLDATRVRF